MSRSTAGRWLALALLLPAVCLAQPAPKAPAKKPDVKAAARKAESAKPEPTWLTPQQATARYQEALKADREGHHRHAFVAYLEAAENGHGHAQKKMGDIYSRNGPVVTFSHGWPLSSDSWESQMLFLADHGYRVIAHDRRGHGRSGQPWEGNDMDHYADDLATVIETLRTPYVEMALLKGASRSRMVLRHALPNAIGPIVNAVALSLSYLLGGVIIVETVFNYPGIAKLMVDAVSTRDLPLIQSCVMIFCVGYLALITAADIVAILSNPRLRS